MMLLFPVLGKPKITNQNNLNQLGQGSQKHLKKYNFKPLSLGRNFTHKNGKLTEGKVMTLTKGLLKKLPS